MNLIKGDTYFYVICLTDDFGYKSDDTYIFPNEEEVKKFLGIYNDYANDTYFNGKDICGINRALGASEYVVEIYSRTIYGVEY